MRIIQRTCQTVAILLVCSTAHSANLAQDVESHNTNASISRRLSSPDPVARQRAAEELARLAAVDQKKLLEGYYLQEKDRKVRLALEWALYRVGKNDALFRIVRDLDSSRQEQAIRYLKQLESPGLLYPFLKQEDSPARITVGLLEALGQLGDSETLELIKPLRDSFVAGVAEAAEVATDKIESRLAQTEPAGPTRPRTAGVTNPTSP
ncbi:MAG: hypothetical protein ACREBG_19660 [Pyrinomonadaceae bacterium]